MPTLFLSALCSAASYSFIPVKPTKSIVKPTAPPVTPPKAAAAKGVRVPQEETQSAINPAETTPNPIAPIAQPNAFHKSELTVYPMLLLSSLTRFLESSTAILS